MSRTYRVLRAALWPFFVFLAPLGFAQVPVPDKSQQIPITVDNQVSSQVSITAILIPPSSAKKTFGTQVAEHYAVVELLVTNHSATNAFIVDEAFLDYSHWLFSNNFQDLGRDDTIDTTTNQSSNKPNQVASAEARLVRGEAQNANSWTARNTLIRAATLVGTIASGYQFLASSTAYLSGISAYGNQVVPALSAFWPDHGQDHLNYISDFGFTTNHVVAKGAGEVIVAFYPIERFLTPGLREIFLKSPATFFVPGEALLDSKTSGYLASLICRSGALATESGADKVPPEACASKSKGKSVAQPDKVNGRISLALMRYEQNRIKAGSVTMNDTDKILVALLDKVSLNNIRVVVGGTMNVDVNAVQAVLDNVTFTSPTNWTKGSTLSGVINGSFLSNGVLSITDDAGNSIGTVNTIPASSTDKKLPFTVTLSADIPTTAKLHFQLTKTAQDKTKTVSKTLDLKISDLPSQIAGPTLTPDPAVASTWAKGSKVTGVLTGSLLTGGTVTVSASAGSVGAAAIVAASSDDSKITFTVTLPATVASGTVLNIVVTKTTSTGDTVSSLPIKYTVNHP